MSGPTSDGGSKGQELLPPPEELGEAMGVGETAGVTELLVGAGVGRGRDGLALETARGVGVASGPDWFLGTVVGVGVGNVVCDGWPIGFCGSSPEIAAASAVGIRSDRSKKIFWAAAGEADKDEVVCCCCKRDGDETGAGEGAAVTCRCSIPFLVHVCPPSVLSTTMPRLPADQICVVFGTA